MRHSTRILPERELAAVCLLVGLGFGLLLVSRIQALVAPQLRLLAAEQVETLMRRNLQTALTEVVANTISDALIFEKDKDGRIAAVNTDVAALSALQRITLTTVHDTVEELELSALHIPLQSFPRMNVSVQAVKLVNASAVFRNELADAGINQTHHSTILEVIAQVDIHLPTFSASTEIKLELVVFETLIVGFVPQFYGESS